MLRVQFRSVDNYAHKNEPAFTLFRDALAGNVIHQLWSSEDSQNNPDHESELVELFKQKGL